MFRLVLTTLMVAGGCGLQLTDLGWPLGDLTPMLADDTLFRPAGDLTTMDEGYLMVSLEDLMGNKSYVATDNQWGVALEHVGFYDHVSKQTDASKVLVPGFDPILGIGDDDTNARRTPGCSGSGGSRVTAGIFMVLAMSMLVLYSTATY